MVWKRQMCISTVLCARSFSLANIHRAAGGVAGSGSLLWVTCQGWQSLFWGNWNWNFEIQRFHLNMRNRNLKATYWGHFLLQWLKSGKAYLQGDGIKTNLWKEVPGFPHSSAGKESTCNAGDPSSISGLGISPGEGIGYLLQIPWIRQWQRTPVFLPGKSHGQKEPVRLQSVGSPKSQTQLSD